MSRYFLAALLTLPSCATTAELPPPTRADTLLTTAGLPSVGKLVIRGPVTFQVAGPGSTQTASAADNRKAGQRQGAAATAPGSQVEQASRKGGQSYWWLVAAAVLAVVGWEVAGARGWLKWLPWRTLQTKL